MCSLSPLIAFAEPGDAQAASAGAIDEEAAEESTNVIVEYRYAEGETPDIPDSIERFGREYRLTGQTEPVLESTLPNERTYTYKIDGKLSPEDIALVGDLPGLTLTPVDVELDREVDKTIIMKGLPHNDVDQIPETKAFKVTSASAAGGTASVMLNRAAVDFIITSDTDGLPEEYEATVIYRGVESYNDVGYYLANMNYKTTQSEGETNYYVIVATYEPVDVTAAPDETETNRAVELATDETPETPDTTPVLGEGQTGNLLYDIFNGKVSLGGFSVTEAWSVLSMLMALAGAAITAMLLIAVIMRHKLRRDIKISDEYHGITPDTSGQRRAVFFAIATFLAIVSGAIVPVIWIVLDDLSLPMVWINKWTIVVGVCFSINIILVFVQKIFKKRNFIEEEGGNPEGMTA
jgi:hypothetical protein